MKAMDLLFAGFLAILIVGCAVGAKKATKKQNSQSNVPNPEVLNEENLSTESTQKHDISMYPEPAEGMDRYLIELAPFSKEEHLKISLVASKEMEVDCNHVRLMGEFSENTVSGWGYSYYQFEGDGSTWSTSMGCPDQKRYRKEIVSSSIMVRYNSKLPIVVYVPSGLKVRYSIWKKDLQKKYAHKG